MKRPQPKPKCDGSRTPHPRHIPDGYGFGVCGACQQQQPFVSVNGKSLPADHPPKKRRRVSGLPRPRGERRLGRRS
jgi:hypothetical protein